IASRQAWSTDESAANQITADRATAGRVIRIKTLTVLLERRGTSFSPCDAMMSSLPKASSSACDRGLRQNEAACTWQMPQIPTARESLIPGEIARLGHD